MSAWQKFIDEVRGHIYELEQDGCDVPFFRGHRDARWSLLCGLERARHDARKTHLESILYYDFLSQGGPLLQRPYSSWDVLFSMQHHGLPTRLLDWSATFSVSVYFALRPYVYHSAAELELLSKTSSNPCVWVLDPFELNLSMSDCKTIINPETDLPNTYQEIFIDEEKESNAEVIAINPTQLGRRLAAQRGCFTLHSNLSMPLEHDSPYYLKKFDIPAEAISDGIGFLKLSGIHEHHLFPDLDGLARHLNKLHVTRN
jgi:hypothetical protein